MPNCVQFFRKSDSSRTPVVLNRLDEELCAYMNVPVHPANWCCEWSVIQFDAAMGKSFQQICDAYKAEAERCEANGLDATWERDIVKISQYLDENFTTDAWAER